MTDTLKALCRLSGVSGREEAVCEFILKEIKHYAETVTVDAMGNVIAFVKGKKPAEAGKKLLFAAHMDEVGIIITDITEDGYLRFDFVGSVDRRVVLGKQVYVGDDAVPGVIGLKAIHLVDKAERDKIPPTEAMYVDIGTETRAEAERLVSLGDVGTFDTHIVEFGSGLLRAKAIDDRIGCAVMLTLIRRGLPMDAYFAFTVQEEVGSRGATTAAYRIEPDVVIILEGTSAADIPSQSGNKKTCCLGKGPVIPFMDKGTIYDRDLYRALTGTAERHNIPWQTKTQIAGGTDGAAFQRSGRGAKTAAVSAAVRYIHSPSCVGSVEDFENILRLLTAYMEEL